MVEVEPERIEPVVSPKVDRGGVSDLSSARNAGTVGAAGTVLDETTIGWLKISPIPD